MGGSRRNLKYVLRAFVLGATHDSTYSPSITPLDSEYESMWARWLTGLTMGRRFSFPC
ncbi:hypothetical protein BDV36DRAFT_253253 [Aspergillus pseudocaelatus]|uniref:Uncharacterized protein n=1 Tax=Aspergillus pseudocaelatus TaxID=1825620 RepID=A0ABQ6WNY7_9EURO|nr:hypothetical protein BDV36DRAFT_253253 [Aspergillus pseudocaelatus]